MNLFKRAITHISHYCPGWQDVGYVTILALSALSAIAFLGEYQAQGEPDISIEAPPVQTKLEPGAGI